MKGVEEHPQKDLTLLLVAILQGEIGGQVTEVGGQGYPGQIAREVVEGLQHRAAPQPVEVASLAAVELEISKGEHLGAGGVFPGLLGAPALDHHRQPSVILGQKMDDAVMVARGVGSGDEAVDGDEHGGGLLSWEFQI